MSFATYSERKVAEALAQQLPDNVVVIANQRFTDRDGDREADLIVMWPDFGIAVIEVKGGLIHRIDGQWRQPWRNARGWKPINPVEQALKAKYALRDYLHQHPRWSRGNPRLIHMLGLPATRLDDDFHAPDAPRWLVMDRTDLPYLADRIASALRNVQGQPRAPTRTSTYCWTVSPARRSHSGICWTVSSSARTPANCSVRIRGESSTW